MGIEPTWDSPHCPTPDLKSGSPTSELGTSGPIYNKNASFCRPLLAWGISDCGFRIEKYKILAERFLSSVLCRLTSDLRPLISYHMPHAPCFITTIYEPLTTDTVRSVALSNPLIYDS
jgi:hypothetical protein